MDKNNGISNDAAAAEKASFKTKAEVFLTYYKWYILIALFFVVFITVMTVQMCTREKYDISVMYAGNDILSDSESAGMERAFENLGKDGEKALLYELIIMDDKELSEAYDKGYSTSAVNMEKIRKNRETFALNVMSDEYFILMLSPECYEIMYSNGALERLDDVGVKESSGIRHSEYALKLHSLEYAKFYTAFSVLPEDTLLCFKKISEINLEKKDKIQKREHDMALFAQMANFTLSAPEAQQTAAIIYGKELL